METDADSGRLRKRVSKSLMADVAPGSTQRLDSDEDACSAGNAEMQPLLLPNEAKEPEEKADASSEASGESSLPNGADSKKLLPEEEGALSIVLQAFFPLFLAGFGQVGAGLVLDHIQHWSVFDEIPELFTLITALVGLKGNLEMTLASRLSTLANMGKMDSATDRVQHVVSNICLVEAQATLLSFLAAVLAITFRWVVHHDIVWLNSLVLISSSLSTGCSAALILAIIMICVIMASRCLKINPDNVATPLAASFGDLITMIILAHMSSFMLRQQPYMPWLCPSVGATLLLLMPIWMSVASFYPSTKNTLTEGLNAIIIAMFISSTSGYILGYAITKFVGIAVFQPVINGFGGNLVAIQASRMSTYLHQHVARAELPEYTGNHVLRNPFYVFFGKHPHRTAARILLLFTIPGHLTCIFLINIVGAGHTSSTVQFVAIYLSAAFLQVAILLYICHVMVHWMWRTGVDPDNMAIPYLTAIGDFLGTSLLSLSFVLLYAIGDRDSDVGD